MGNKALLILLILIIVVFIVFAVWGASNNAQKSPARPPHSGTPPCNNKQQPQGGPDPCVDADSFNNPQSHHPSFLDGLNGLLGSFGPKLTPAQMQPTFPLVAAGGKTKSPVLTLTATHYSILISPDSHQFRQAKFANTRGCAHLVYKPAAGAPKNLENPQDSDKSKNPNEISFTIVQAGGELTIDRRSSPCTVTLE